MLNKLFSADPSAKKLQSIVAIALSALVLIFCFVDVFFVANESKEETTNLETYFSGEDQGFLNILMIITAIASLVLVALPMLNIQGIPTLPAIVTYLPGIIAGAIQAYGLLLGWFDMIDAFGELKKVANKIGMKFSYGLNFAGILALVSSLALIGFMVALLKNNMGKKAAPAEPQA